MTQPRYDDDVVTWDLESELIARETRVRSMHSKLRQENKELKERVERLKILLSDAPEFEEEKIVMLETLHQSSAREQAVKQRMKEEEKENECLEDAVADLRYIIKSEKPMRLRLQDLKQAVFKARRRVEEMYYILAEKDEVIRKRNAEVTELLALYWNCMLHAEENEARLNDAEKAALEILRVRERELVCVRGRELLCVRGRQLLCVREREEVCEVRGKKTPPALVKTVHSDVKPSRGKHVLLIVCSFALTLPFVFFFIFSVIQSCNSEKESALPCTEFLQDRVKKLLESYSAIRQTGPPVH